MQFFFFKIQIFCLNYWVVFISKTAPLTKVTNVFIVSPPWLSQSETTVKQSGRSVAKTRDHQERRSWIILELSETFWTTVYLVLSWFQSCCENTFEEKKGTENVKTVQKKTNLYSVPNRAETNSDCYRQKFCGDNIFV